MTIKETLEYLRAIGPTTKVTRLGGPHSYRGSYDCLALELRGDSMTAAELEALLESCLSEGRVFIGWKGGEYTMTLECDIYIAWAGKTGQLLEKSMLMSQG